MSSENDVGRANAKRVRNLIEIFEGQLYVHQFPLALMSNDRGWANEHYSLMTAGERGHRMSPSYRIEK